MNDESKILQSAPREDKWVDVRQELRYDAPSVLDDYSSTNHLTFDAFQRVNELRCKTEFEMCDDWSLNDWAVALAGEVGELCNLLKKDRRGLATDERYDLDGPFYELAKQNVVNELADVITYADLMMTKLGASTAFELIGKFNEVSKRVGFEMSAPPVSKEPVNGRDIWFQKIRPIINAIGEISVQEAMDAVERMLEGK